MVAFLALAIISLSLGIASIIALRLKIPPLIVFLTMGMVVGVYGILQQNSIISFLGDLGSVLLLFAIGTEFSIHRLVSTGFLRETKVAVIEVMFTFFLLCLVFSIWFSLDLALLLALTFSITSTGVTLKLLQQLNLSKKFDIPLIVKISVIEDLIAVFLLTLISSFAVAAGQPIDLILESFLISIILFVIAYYLFSLFFNKFLFRFNIQEEDLLMLALGLLLLMVSLSGILGLSTSFGAYISGSIVSTWKDKWRGLERDLKNFSYLFISFFFLTVGLQVSLDSINYLLLLLIIPLVLAIKFGGMFLGTFEAFRSSRVAIFTSIGMLSRGELSLVIVSAAVTSGLLPQSFLGFTALVVLSTVIVTYLLVGRSMDIYMFLRLRFPKKLTG